MKKKTSASAARTVEEIDNEIELVTAKDHELIQRIADLEEQLADKWNEPPDQAILDELRALNAQQKAGEIVLQRLQAERPQAEIAALRAELQAAESVEKDRHKKHEQAKAALEKARAEIKSLENEAGDANRARVAASATVNETRKRLRILEEHAAAKLPRPTADPVEHRPLTNANRPDFGNW